MAITTLEIPATTEQPPVLRVASDAAEADAAANLLELADVADVEQIPTGECAIPIGDQPVIEVPQTELAGRVNNGDRKAYHRDKSALEERLSALMIEELKLREELKGCRQEAKELAAELSSLIDRWEHRNLPTSVPASVLPAGPASESSATSLDSDAAEQLRYRTVLESATLATLGLPPKLQERLEEAGIGNVWQLEQLRSEIGLGSGKWPKGIGTAKITLIEDAIVSWMAHNQATWSPSHRTAAEIDATNQQIEDEQDEARAADVSEVESAAESDAADMDIDADDSDDGDPLDEL